jgi:hypothetical protein
MNPLSLIAALPQVLLAAPFNAFYAAGFVLVFVLVWRDRGGHTVGVPEDRAVRVWFLLAVAVAGVLGSRLLHFDLHIDGTGDRTVLGGLLGVYAAAHLAARVLRAGRPLTDALAVALPLGFAVGRLGCLAAGCCFGAVSSLPWSVSYGAGSAAFAAQVEAGLLAADAVRTHGVHPVQLYEAGIALLIAFAARRARRHGVTGLLTPVAMAYLAMRLPLQLLRGSGESATAVAIVVVLALAAAVVVVVRMRPGAGRRAVLNPGGVLGIGLLVTGGLVTVRIATPLELAVLTVIGLLGAGGYLAGVVGHRRAVSRPRACGHRAHRAVYPHFSPRYVAAMPVLVLLLQIPADSTAFPQRYVTVGASAMGGRYVETCGGAHSYRVGGVSASYVSLPAPKQRYSVRGTVFGGVDRDEELAGWSGDANTQLGGVAVVGSARYHWIGASAGLMVGSLYFDGSSETILPVAALTLGPPAVYAEGRIYDAEPVGMPAPGIQLGLAARLDRQGSLLRAGVSDAGVYLSGIVVAGDWEIEPRAALGDESTGQFALAVRKRFAIRR